MDLQTIKDQTATKISNDERAGLNPQSVMYIYTDTVYFAVEAADILWNGRDCPHGDAEMIHDLIIASQIVGAKYHANELVHYLFVPGNVRFTSKVRAKFLKTHVQFHDLTGKHDLAAFYQSIGRNLVKPSQNFLNEDVFNIG